MVISFLLCYNTIMECTPLKSGRCIMEGAVFNEKAFCGTLNGLGAAVHYQYCLG